MKSDTPRTDRECFGGHCVDVSEEYVYSCFARELERENARLRESLAEIMADTEPGKYPSHNARDRAYATARSVLRSA